MIGQRRTGLLQRAAACLRRRAWLAPAGLTLYLAIKGAVPDLPGLSCPLRAATGIPCPTCYLTRATAAALNGRLSESLALHAFGPPAAILLLLWAVLALRRRRFLPVTIPGWSLGLAGLGLVAYWLARLVAQHGLGLAAFPPA
ncbi:MAG: DUF2752 domain-containing protein [Synechococcaceae cyanobacterium]|nr:DUF2752 domain-containing protein [Synechococcaceae cyanobacterium]